MMNSNEYFERWKEILEQFSTVFGYLVFERVQLLNVIGLLLLDTGKDFYEVGSLDFESLKNVEIDYDFSDNAETSERTVIFRVRKKEDGTA